MLAICVWTRPLLVVSSLSIFVLVAASTLVVAGSVFAVCLSIGPLLVVVSLSIIVLAASTLAVPVWTGPLSAPSRSFEPVLAESSLMGSENEAEVQVLLSILKICCV